MLKELHKHLILYHHIPIFINLELDLCYAINQHDVLLDLVHPFQRVGKELRVHEWVEIYDVEVDELEDVLLEDFFVVDGEDLLDDGLGEGGVGG